MIRKSKNLDKTKSKPISQDNSGKTRTPGWSQRVFEKKYTRAERRASEQEQIKFAISDHVARANDVDFENPKTLDREHSKKPRNLEK